MDLGLVSVKDKSEAAGTGVDDGISVEAVFVTGNDVDSSGSCVNERIGDQVDSRDLNDECNQNGDRLLSSPCVNSGSAGGSGSKKGFGLRKWKRIRRGDRVTSVSPGLDTGKPLKRQISGINNTSSQLMQSREESGDFVEHVYGLDISLEGLRYSPAQVSTVFAMGGVSENSEDRSSKSSTAASSPRRGTGMPLGSPSGDKMKPNNLTVNGFYNSTQMGQLAKGRVDPGKKLRGGERVEREKEISHSSLESDSRSSNFVLMQTSSLRQSEASVNYNGEGGEEIPGEPHFTDDQTARNQANEREAGDSSHHDLGAEFSWEGNEKNNGSPTRQDPLVDSIHTLDSVGEALEKELQKFKEIGKDSYFTSADSEVSVNTYDYMNGEDSAHNAHGPGYLAEKITHLESKLVETSDALRIKELKVGGLEAAMQSVCLHKGDTYNTIGELKSAKKLESELEILFAQKVEADVMYIATANALQDAKHGAAISKPLLDEQKVLADEQLELQTRLEQTECSVGKVKRQAKEPETAVTGGSISKLACYSLTQLLMLLVALWAVYLKWVSDYGAVVPT